MTLVRDFIHAYDEINYGLLCIVVILSLAACIYLARKEKKWILASLLALYASFLLAGTLLNRVPDDVCEAKLVPFWSYWEMLVIQRENMWKQVLYNIFVFMPWGILLPVTFVKLRRMRMTLLSAAIFSASIEIIQLIFRLGFFEFDDIFNTYDDL